MLAVRRWRSISGTFVATLALLAGCATMRPPAIEPQPLEEPGAPQAIAVVVPVSDLVAGFVTPDQGQSIAGGALRGAASGAFLPLYAGAYVWPLLLWPPMLAVTGVFMAAGALIGASSGAAVVVPPQEVAAVAPVVDDAIGRISLPELTAKELAIDVARWTPYHAEVIDDAVLPPGAGVPHFRALRERGFGAVLHVRITGAGFTGRGGSDPGIRIYLVAEADLRDTASAKATSRRGLVYLSAPREENRWTADDGALTKIELERGYRRLAERIVDDLVLQAELQLGSPQRYTCGVEPTVPKLEWEGILVGPRRPAAATVPSLTPVLAWQAVPTPVSGADETRWTKVDADSIRYDVRIWKAVDDAPGEIVYERDGLERPEHALESGLEPGTTYFWSVRLRYRVDGHLRATRWSAANVPAFAPPVPFGSTLYYSRLERDPAGAACAPPALTPCGCLDFIPRQNFYRFRTP